MIEQGKDRDHCYHLLQISNNPADLETSRKLKNKHNNAIKHAKANYINQQTPKHLKDPRTFWKVIQDLDPAEQKGITSLYNEKTQEIIDTNKQSDYINNYVANIGVNLANKINKVAPGDGKFIPPTNTQTWDIKEVTNEEVLKRILELSLYKSSGIAGLGTRIVKDTLMHLLIPFTHILNLSLCKGQFPNAWKLATVIPIPKIANSKTCNDLRPISLLPIPGKILEQLIHNQIQNFYETSNYLTQSQFGFRAGKSTTWQFLS